MHSTQTSTVPASDADLAGAQLRLAMTAREITWLHREARELLDTPIADRDEHYDRRRAAYMARKREALQKADST